MFVLSRLKSLVRLEPKDFNRPLPEALADVLNAKLANKIVQGKRSFSFFSPFS
jgi:DNA-directed RNA polymerase subunit E'/Rpb7